MKRLAFETDDDLTEAVVRLRSLGWRARKLLAELVETQGVTRSAVSQAALTLENAGFIFVRDYGDIFKPKFEISPSLAGEEALEALEHAENGADITISANTIPEKG